MVEETFSCQLYGGSLLPYLRLRVNRQRAGLFPTRTTTLSDGCGQVSSRPRAAQGLKR
jgi:hypothetical protein